MQRLLEPHLHLGFFELAAAGSFARLFEVSLRVGAGSAQLIERLGYRAGGVGLALALTEQLRQVPVECGRVGRHHRVKPIDGGERLLDPRASLTGQDTFGGIGFESVLELSETVREELPAFVHGGDTNLVLRARGRQARNSRSSTRARAA